MLEVQKKLHSLKNDKKKSVLMKFFKTGKGEYGEGDLFLGITVPVLRKLSKEYCNLLYSEIKILLESKFHEERALGTFILVINYQKAVKNNDIKKQKEIFNFYLKNIKAFNNWDLVDLSAPYITGHYFFHVNVTKIEVLKKSSNLWKRRIAILSTFYFIRQNEFNLAIAIIGDRLYDNEDLIHKACGWMLREIGKRDKTELLKFLDKHAAKMPRTALRYSIEKLEKNKIKYYMNLKNKEGK